MAPVLVLRSNDICFLGILRSCHHAGLKTESVTFDWPGAGPWHSESSRHFQRNHRISNPYVTPADAVAEFDLILEGFIDRFGQPAVVVPSSDTNLMFLLDNLPQFSGRFSLMGSQEHCPYPLEIVDKGRCMQILQSQDVGVPQSFSCSEPTHIDTICSEVRYPCVYKPATKDYGQSFYRAHQGLKAVECDGADQLRSALRDEIEAGFQLVVQEKIHFAGPVDEVPFYLYSDPCGEIRYAATALKRHIQPYPFGTATALELTWHEELLPMAQSVVDALGWRGILMIEFIRDRADGQWKVIELNPRPWLFVDFFRRYGINFFAGLASSSKPDGGQVAVIRPGPNVLDWRPVHLDLTALLSRAPDEGGLDSVSQIRERFQGELSSTYFDPEDPAPGMNEWQMICAQRRWNTADLERELREALGGISD